MMEEKEVQKVVVEGVELKAKGKARKETAFPESTIFVQSKVRGGKMVPISSKKRRACIIVWHKLPDSHHWRMEFKSIAKFRSFCYTNKIRYDFHRTLKDEIDKGVKSDQYSMRLEGGVYVVEFTKLPVGATESKLLKESLERGVDEFTNIASACAFLAALGINLPYRLARAQTENGASYTHFGLFTIRHATVWKNGRTTKGGAPLPNSISVQRKKLEEAKKRLLEEVQNI